MVLLILIRRVLWKIWEFSSIFGSYSMILNDEIILQKESNMDNGITHAKFWGTNFEANF